jgi:hypothetical protein
LLGIAIVTGIALAVLALFLLSGTANPILWAAAAFVIVLGVIAALVTVAVPPARSADKAKRGLEGLDMYSLIDRLVDDLDGDELAYLKQRLDERESGGREDLEVSVKTLLEQRDADRAAGRR